MRLIIMNMTVVNKKNDEKCQVYDITYDKAGYPHFLIYKDGEWLRLSAKHFRPLSEEDWLKDFGCFFGNGVLKV